MHLSEDAADGMHIFRGDRPRKDLQEALLLKVLQLSTA